MSDSALTRTSTETRSQNPSSVLPGALTGWRPDQGWILDHLLEGFQLIDHDWRYLYVNAAVARHARKSPTELIGRTMMDCFPGIDQTPMFALLQKCMRERIATTMDNTFHYEDGTEATFQLSIQPVAEGILVMSIDISEEKRTEGVLRWQKQMLEHVINGTSLEELLQELIDFIESQIPGGLCSVLLADDDGKSLHHLAGPRLPESYNSKLGLVPIGESIGSCGTAAYRKRPVVVADISADPLWKEYRQLALENHLASCWSVPIIEAGTGTADSRVLGTFAVYHRQPTKPTDDQLELVSIGARMAGIAI